MNMLYVFLMATLLKSLPVLAADPDLNAFDLRNGASEKTENRGVTEDDVSRFDMRALNTVLADVAQLPEKTTSISQDESIKRADQGDSINPKQKTHKMLKTDAVSFAKMKRGTCTFTFPGRRKVSGIWFPPQEYMTFAEFRDSLREFKKQHIKDDEDIGVVLMEGRLVTEETLPTMAPNFSDISTLQIFVGKKKL